jgi:hypothetical protein
MRWIFGLGGIVVMLGVFVYFLSAKGGGMAYLQQTTSAGQKARVQAQQIAGVDPQGLHAKDTIKLEPVEGGSQLRGLKVTSIIPGGVMEAHFGLQLNDVILTIGDLDVGMNNNFELAEARAWEASQRSQDLIVDRGGTLLKLPGNIPVDASGNPVAPPQQPTATPAPTNAAPTNTPSRSTPPSQREHINKMLEGIGAQPPTH